MQMRPGYGTVGRGWGPEQRRWAVWDKNDNKMECEQWTCVQNIMHG